MGGPLHPPHWPMGGPFCPPNQALHGPWEVPSIHPMRFSVAHGRSPLSTQRGCPWQVPSVHPTGLSMARGSSLAAQPGPHVLWSLLTSGGVILVAVAIITGGTWVSPPPLPLPPCGCGGGHSGPHLGNLLPGCSPPPPPPSTLGLVSPGTDRGTLGAAHGHDSGCREGFGGGGCPLHELGCRDPPPGAGRLRRD